jgi:hypothetical protein
MDVVLASRLFKPWEIKFSNYCRLFLQVLSFSDMYNMQGNALAVGIYDGYQSVSQSRSVLLEPLQERPSKVTWSLWRRFLRSITANGCWVEPLGPWYNGLSTHCRWPSYFVPSRDMLYCYACKELVSHQQIGPNDFLERRTTYAIQQLPKDAIPVNMTDIDVGWYMFHTALLAPLEMNLVAFQTFAEYLQSQPEHQSLLLQRFELLAEDIFVVCEQIRVLSEIILVSNRGTNNDYGLYGWVVSTHKGKKIAQGSGSVFGSNPQSYRAEGYGAKAGMLFLIHCFKYSNVPIPEGQFTFYCNYEGLLKKLQYMQSYNNAINATVLHSEWDIVSAVYRLQSSFHPLPDLQHVKGHQQDDGTPVKFLDIPSRMNVVAIKLATYDLQEYGSMKPIVPFDPMSGIQLSFNGQTVTRRIHAAIHQQQHFVPLQQYYQSRLHWNQEAFNDIDWTNFAIVYRRFPRQRTFFSKLGWKKLLVAAGLHKQTPCYDHRCPTCNTDNKDDDNIYQCENIS